MNYNPGHIDLSGLPRAIDFDAQVARNREILRELPSYEDYLEYFDPTPINAGDDYLAPLDYDSWYENLVEYQSKKQPDFVSVFEGLPKLFDSTFPGR